MRDAMRVREGGECTLKHVGSCSLASMLFHQEAGYNFLVPKARPLTPLTPLTRFGADCDA